MSKCQNTFQYVIIKIGARLYCEFQIEIMNSLAQRFVLNRQNVYIFKEFNILQSCSKCVRQMHLFKNQCQSLTETHWSSLALTQNVHRTLNSIVYTPIRLKYDRKNPNSNQDSDDENDDNDNLDEFRDGKSDRVSQIKVQTLRLDAVIKAGLGMSKK